MAEAPTPTVLSFAQERLWFLDRLEPGRTPYNSVSVWGLSGELCLEALERALGEIIRRHDALRTTFTEVDGTPLQLVGPFTGFTLPVEDLRSAPVVHHHADIGRCAREEETRPFDLTTGPLVRARLLRLRDEEHVLLLSIHHIVIDGWSLGVLFRELTALYEAYRAGLESPLPDLPVQYADFAVWQRNQMRGARLDAQLAYWRARLTGAPAVLALPTDHPRPAAQTYRGARERTQLPFELLQGLRALGRRDGATLYMVLLAAFQWLLGRYTGSGDVVVGSAVAGRTRPELERLIGFFANTLVMRTDVSGEPTFRELLLRVRHVALGAYEHQDLPFERLVAELQPERSVSRSPLIQVMFGVGVSARFQLPDTAGGGPQLSGLRVRRIHPDVETTIFDLMLYVVPHPRWIETSLTYSTDLFDQTTIQRLLRHLTRLLEQVVAEPDTPLSRMALLDAAERRQVLDAWNQTDTADTAERCIHDLFDAQARRTPDVIAVAGDGMSLTYAGLNVRANRLANHLRRLGVGAEVRVALCLERSLDVVVALLGILKAGGTYVPLDTGYPAERLAFMLADADARVLLTSDALRIGLPARPGLTVLGVDSAAAAIARECGEPPWSGAGPRSLAYVMYTSGSTGTPKGVAVEHRSVVRLVRGANYVRLGPDTVTLQAAPVSFDASTFEVWGPLLNGGRIVVTAATTPSLEELGHALVRHAVTTQWLTAGLFQLMVEHRPDDLRGVSQLLAGGDVVPADAVARLQRQFPAMAVINGYGPTENTTFTCCYTVPAGWSDGALPIGSPISNTRVYVLDSALQPVPIGLPGELYTGGLGVARGYLDQPGITATRFMPDPFGAPGDRLYRTGDRVRWRADGTVAFLGRLDEQIKIRGFRVEPGEIEAALRRLEAVADAVVVVEPETQRLLAYVVRRKDDAARLSAHLMDWRGVFDAAYGAAADAAGDFNIAGWEDSFSSAPIPAEAMREWVEETVGRIRRLQPRRVLEIGCGTGLLLARLAPECEAYTGVDLSSEAVAFVSRAVAQQPALAHVDVRQAAAHELAFVPTGSCDVVILNSVVQYFPDTTYLVQVLTQAVRIVGGGGRIFVGDVRNLALAQVFHAAVALHRAPDAMLAAEVQQHAADALARETELLLAPEFFGRLADEGFGIARVDVVLKAGSYDNELSQFRYDVVLTVGAGRHRLVDPPRSVQWDAGGAWIGVLETARAEAPAASMAVRDIPHRKVARAVAVAERLGSGQASTAGAIRQATASSTQGSDVKDIERLAELWGVEWATRGVNARGRFDVIFNPQWHAGSMEAAPARLESLASTPLTGQSRNITARLREHLAQVLPPYMVPSAIVELACLPLTPNGKVDRQALPVPVMPGAATRGAPGSTDEEILAAIWANVLRVDRVDRDDNFFDLGGHSLLAMRAVSRIRDTLGVELPLRVLFESPTIAALARRVDALRRSRRAVLPPVVRLPRTAAVPLSFAQERLWFLDRLQPGNTAYNISAPLRLTGRLDVAALERALAEIVRRHEALRTTFGGVDDVAVQVIAPFDGFSLPIEDLSRIEQTTREAAAQRRIDQEARQPFDLGAGPHFRAALLRLDEEDSILLLSMHHVVSDEWSLGVLFRELAALYDAYAAGRDSPLPPLPVQYADFAVWQRAQFQGDVLEAQLAYWRTQLAGAPALLELPIDRPRPPVQTHHGAVEPIAESPELVARLEAAGRPDGATLYMVLLAALQVLLGKYAGSDDVIVGSPIAGRTCGEVEGLIGFFVNTLVLRTDLSGDPGFREVLRRVRRVTLEAYDRQDVPFEKLVEALQPERSLSHSPLFQVLFTMLEGTGSPERLSGLAVSRMTVERATAKFDLALNLAATDEGLVGAMSYRTDLFERRSVRRLVRHFARVLEQVATDPDIPLSRITLLDASERAQVIEAWNQTDVAVTPALVHQRFEAQVARTPDAVALLCGGETLSYAALNARADRLAGCLRRLGVGPDVRVGIHVEPGLAMVVAVLGVLKADGAYVPLDPAYPVGRLELMLTDSGSRVLLTRPRHRAVVPAPADAIVVDLDAAVETSQDEPVPAGRAGLGNLAYVLYTSGSTGRPKGVAVEHSALDSYVSWATQTYPGHSAVLHSSLSFDFTVTPLFVPLLCGGCVEVLSDADRGDALVRRINRNPAVPLLKLTPTHLRALGELLDHSGASHGPDCLVVGGEALVGEQLGAWRRWPETRLVNEYGPTETVVGCCVHERRLRDVGAGRIAIGHPVWNTRLYVLDAAGAPVPTGLPGELYIGGAQVTRGYLNHPALTAARFVPDPFAARGGQRLFRTGDTVVRHADGSLAYIRRIDEQVKIRGFRIEPHEIVVALQQHAGVIDCAVVARDDRRGGQRLVAYVVGDADPATLRAHLGPLLPSHMIPSAFVRMERLPVTINGKLNRDALPEPEHTASEPAYVAPSTAVERELARIWATVLQIEQVGVTANFFEAGGDSILCLQVVAQARRAGFELTPQQMFEYQTIASLASVVRARPSPPLERAPADGPVGLTPIQAWFFEQEHAVPSHHNQSMWLDVDPIVAEGDLEKAVRAVVDHHDACRLRFRRTGAGWEQWYAADAGIALERVNLTGLPRDDQHRTQAETAERCHASLHLERGPLGRAVLFDCGTQGRRLFVVLHHLIVDGVSWRVLREDLERACDHVRERASVALGAAGTSFGQWSALLDAYASSEVLGGELAYWLAQSGDPAPGLPDGGDGPRGASDRRSVTVRLETQETRALLQEVPAAYRTQINDVLLCALADAIQAWTGRSRVRVLLEGHGRDADIGADADVVRTVGWFTTQYPVLLDIAGTSGPGERLQRIKEQLRSVPNRGIGYGVLRYLSPNAGVREQLASHPGPGILFNYLGQFDGNAHARFRFVSGFRGHECARENRLPAPLVVNGSVSDGSLHIVFVYDEAVHRGERIERLSQLYRDALGALIAHCRQDGVGGYTPSDFPLAGLTQQQMNALLGSRRGVEDLYPLSPMQEGMLFHAMLGGETQAYHVQVLREMHGALDVALFKRAWDEIVRRHAVFRTAYLWEGLARPLQHVMAAVDVPWLVEDLTGRTADAHEAALDRYLADDRARGFRLDQPPLCRCALFRMSADRHSFVWSYHHSIMDGWSSPRLLSDVFGVYEASTTGRTHEPRPVRPYRDYIRWLTRQDLGAAETYWREALAGFPWPTPVSVGTPARRGVAVRHAQEDLRLSAELTQRVQETARRMKVTVNTMMQGAWGLLLSRYSGETDVLFGHVVSGRPADLDGAEEIIGLFINTLPVRMRVGPESRVSAWLREFQVAQAEARKYAYAPLTRIQACSQVPRDVPLFESHFTFENYPRESAASAALDGPLRMTRKLVIERSTFPLALVVMPSQPLVLRLCYDANRFERDAVVGMLGHLARILEQMAANPDRRLCEVALASACRGRVDAYETIRGYRIDPHQVAAVLRSNPAVRDAHVAARESASGARRLVAYVVGDVDAGSLRAHLQDTLPEYMVPADVVAMDSLPCTPEGRVDEMALPAPGEPERTARRLRTDIEERVASAWRSVLAVAEVRADDNFFDVGGNSLLLYRVHSELRSIRPDLRMVDLFRYTTVESLARHLATQAPLPAAPDASHARAATVLAESRARVQRRRAARQRAVQ